MLKEKHSVGKTIAKLRKEKGFTQVELAERLNISDKAVSKWESEAGFPEISQFPALAELFGVTIDYLMTGKEQGEKIVTISRAELCAKNDDIKMLTSIDWRNKDESGNKLIYYIIKYESLRVFKALVDSEESSVNLNILLSSFKVIEAIKLSILSNRLDIISNISIYSKRIKSIKSLASVNEENWIKNNQMHNACILTDEIFKLIVCDKRITKETFDFITAPYENTNNIWSWGFPYLIHQSYLNNKKDKFEKLLSIAEKNNDYAFDNEQASSTTWFYQMIIPNERFAFGVVRILEATIKEALARLDFDNVKRLNAMNKKLMAKNSSWLRCYIASDYEIKMAKINADTKLSETEKAIEASLFGEMLSIEKLLEIKDFKIIKDMLYKYPIHIVEVFSKWIDNKQWGKISEFANDNYLTDWRYMLEDKDEQQIKEKVLQLYWIGQREWQPHDQLTNRYKFYTFNKKYFNLRNYNYRSEPLNTFDSVLIYLSKCRDQIVCDMSLKLDKEKMTNSLTRNFFEEQLAKGNIEIVIIKLCVKLEAILKCDYHYTGEFKEMLDTYLSNCGQVDDGWGYMLESEQSKLFNRLRLCRNGIVHAEPTDEILTVDEIKSCIDYIFAMESN